MNSPLVFKEYIWLVNTIYQAKKISLREISNKWKETEMGGGLPLSRSTFNRHKIAIEEIFGLYIECDLEDKFKYYIGNAYLLQEDTIQNWMLSTLTVNNTISENLSSLRDRIILEAIPSEGDNLCKVIGCIKNDYKINIEYQKYSTSEPKNYLIEPYCIKLFRRRWYLLGKKSGTNEFRTLSFDRMIKVDITKDKFRMDKSFNAEQYYKDCFGIVSGDSTEVQTVKLRAFGTERLSMRDLPIHYSQKEIFTSNEYSDFELTLRPTLDFSGYIVSRSCLLKVLEPQWLSDKIQKMHEDAMKLYQD